MSLRKDIEELGFSISSDIDHAECFYDFTALLEFHDNLDKLKRLSIIYYDENQSMLDEE